MPKKLDRKRNDHGVKMKIFVNGIDDVVGQHEMPLRNIEAGSWLHGVIVMQHAPFIQQYLLAKFSIEGRHRIKHIHTTYHRSEEGVEIAVPHTKYKEKKFKKNKDKVALALSSYTSENPSSYDLIFPFSIFISDQWCDSFHNSHAMCDYKLKLKGKFPGTDLKATAKRDIDIMRRRPTINELQQKVPVDTESHSSLFGGKVKAVVSLNSAVFMEGTPVEFTACISNTMDKPLMDGKLELEEETVITVLGTDEKHDREHWGYESHIRDLINVKYRSMEIPEKSQSTLIFSLDLPKIVEPPTTGFTEKHHKCRIQHWLKLHIDVPWGSDVRIKFPVTIVPDPRRYAVCPPPEAIVPVQDCALAQYVSLPATPVPYVPVSLPPMYIMSVTLIRGVKLPKMDFTFGGLRGGADPYVTFFLSIGNAGDTNAPKHIRSSRVINNTQNPEWNERFTFIFNHAVNGSDQLTLRFNCYDYDVGSKNDKIGNGDIVTPLLAQDQEFQVKLEHPKKKGKDRGTLVVSVSPITQLQ